MAGKIAKHLERAFERGATVVLADGTECKKADDCPEGTIFVREIREPEAGAAKRAKKAEGS